MTLADTAMRAVAFVVALCFLGLCVEIIRVCNTMSLTSSPPAVKTRSTPSPVSNSTRTNSTPPWAPMKRDQNVKPMVFAQNNKTLLIIIGNLRCGEYAWRSLYENVLDFPENAVAGVDLALMIGGSRIMSYPNSTLYSRAKYSWHIHEYEDWADALDLIDGPGWRQRIQRPERNIVLGGIKGIIGTGAITLMHRWFLSRQLQELRLPEVYGRFIITRSDLFYKCPLILSELDNRFVWVPEGLDFGGICDRHAIVPSKYIFHALDILPPYLASPESYYRADNPEGLILDRWINNSLIDHVRRNPRNMYICVEQVQKDHFRWGGMFNDSGGYGIKYLREYELSAFTCAASQQSIETRTNCSVVFKDRTMALCYYTPGERFFSNLGEKLLGYSLVVDLVQGLLEQHFFCTAKQIPIINLKYDSRDEHICLFTVGELFHAVHQGDHVWGTGVYNPLYLDYHISPSPPVHLHSVRGPLTGDYLKQKTKLLQGQSQSLPFGDPAFLIPFIYPVRLVTFGAGDKTCLMTDLRTEKQAVVKQIVNYIQLEFYRNSSFPIRYFTLHDDWVTLAGVIAGCKSVLSSSVSAIALANALGTPAQWIRLENTSDRTTESDFEYIDYVRGIAHEEFQSYSYPLLISSSTDLYNLSLPPIIPSAKREEIAQRIKDSFPYNLFTTIPI